MGPAARLVVVALLIGGGALAGLLLTRDRADTPRSALAAAQAATADLALEFETDDPGRAAAFVSDAYGRRVRPPALRGYALLGVAPAELDDEATTPAFLYEGPEGALPVVALDYALLDAAGDRLALGPDVRGLLSDDTRAFERETPTGAAVVWRDRDDLFFAFPADAGALAEAVVLPQR